MFLFFINMEDTQLSHQGLEDFRDREVHCPRGAEGFHSSITTC